MTLAYFHWAICVYVRRKYGPKDELEAGGRYSEVVMAMIRVLRRDPGRLVEYEALLPDDMQSRLYSKSFKQSCND